MKKLAVLLAVVCLLALAQAGYAADLQAGWYARIYPVWAFTSGPNGPVPLDYAYFTTPTGIYGPFTLTNAAPNDNERRYISVLTTEYGVDPDRSLSLPLSWGISADSSVDYIRFGWATNYDPSQMYLRLWWRPYGGTDSVVWSQMLGGARFSTEQDIYLYRTQLGSYRFELVAVPEPSTLVVLLTSAIGAAVALRRRTF